MADVILVHGMWSHPGVLEPLRTFLSNRGHQVHVPLLPGHDPAHPWSNELLADLSLRDLVDAVERFIEDEDFDQPPILAGHSMGGLVAQMVAARRKVGGLVLLNSAGPRGVNHVYPSAVLATLGVLTQPFFWKRTNWPGLPIARFGLLNRVPYEIAREIHASLGRESGRCFFELVFWFLDRTRTTEIDFGNVDAPVLVVSSGRDRIIHPRIGMALRQRYPNCDHQHFSKSGHWLCHEAGSHKVFGELERWIAATTSHQLSGPREKTGKLHHALPQVSRSTSIFPQQPPGFRRFLTEARSARRNSAKNAKVSRGIAASISPMRSGAGRTRKK